MNLVPDKVLTQHIAIVGRTGSGKTYTAKGFIERLLELKRRVIVLDPTGAHWGLRILANGKHGYHIPIIGGEHGDAPLTVENAERLAQWLVDKNVSAVIDLSEMLIGERHRFIEHFSDAIYRLNKTPLHLVVDEADEFMMQNPLPETRRMFHNMDRIVRRGRIKGFRVMMITQRPAVLHKNVLSQANTLIAMRLMSPQDRKAIEAWVEGQADAKQGKAVLDSLAKLQRGEGWLWSPEYDVLERVKFPTIKTFDSSRTPEDGEELPSTDRSPSTDFAELRTLLSGDVITTPINNAHSAIDYEQQQEIEKNAFERGYQAGYEAATLEAKKQWQEITNKVVTVINEPITAHTISSVIPNDYQSTQEKLVINNNIDSSKRNSSLLKAERLILTALAQYPQGRSITQVAILTNYAVNGGGFRNAIGSLRTKGFITGNGDRLQITQLGRNALGPIIPLPRGQALLNHWLNKLGKAEKAILHTLTASYPKQLTPHDIAKKTGYEANGGGFRNALGRLRTLELIEGRGELKASDNLFL